MLTPERKLDLSHSPPTSTDQPGARLLAFHNAWRAAPPGIYSITKKGFHWTWKLQPPTLKYPTQIATNQNADLNLAIENLINIRAVYQIPLQPCFLSPIFLVPKRTGGYRFIINLKQLNKFIEVPHFHMTNHVSLAAMLKPPAWAASLDLKDAYFHVPIIKTLHKYLAFMVNKKLFFFKALPFGLGIAPFLFTRVMRYPLGLLHQQGISVLAYLDDWIVWGPSPEETYQSVLKTTELLSNLGFLINKEKSQPVLLPELEWLGIQWFTQSGHWGIPQQKQMELMNVIKRFYTNSTCSRRSWERLIGSLNFVTQILTQSRHLLQPLLRPQLLGSTSTRDLLRPVPDQLRKALIPWMNPLILKPFTWITILSSYGQMHP